jgi:hypothetical protein
MAGGQELTPPVEPLDHQMGGALVPLAPNHPDHLSHQRVVRRRDPNPFDVTRRGLLNMAVGV